MQVYLYNTYNTNHTSYDQDRCVNNVFNSANALYCVQSGVLLTKFGHKLLLSLSAQPDFV